MQHASQAIDEVRRAEFFRKRGNCRLLLTRWINLTSDKRQKLNSIVCEKILRPCGSKSGEWMYTELYLRSSKWKFRLMDGNHEDASSRIHGDTLENTPRRGAEVVDPTKRGHPGPKFRTPSTCV
jgi:hypothetical protein